MLFSQFIVDRLQTLTRASRGYGDQISERSLYEALMPRLNDPAQFASLISWGLATGLLTELTSEQGRRFGVNRAVLACWRTRANGESPFSVDLPVGPGTVSTSFNKAAPNRPELPGQTPPA